MVVYASHDEKFMASECTIHVKIQQIFRFSKKSSIQVYLQMFRNYFSYAQQKSFIRKLANYLI